MPVLLVFAILLPVLAPPPAPAQAQAGSAEAAIRALLEDRALAVTESDEPAFRRTLGSPRGPYGSSALRSFRGLTSLPLGSYSLRPSFDAYGDLVRPSDEARYPDAAEVRIYLVQERYAFEGFDEREVFQDHYLTFVRSGENWLIASDSDLEDVGLFSQKNIWDFGAPEISRSANLLGLGAPGSDPSALLDVAETARRRVMERWSRPWSERTVLIQPADAGQIARIIQATYDVAPYVAFAFWTGGAKDFPGARIIAEPEAFASASPERALSILTHEMFHVAALESSGPSMPHFIDEGYAQWVQYAGDGAALSRAHGYADGDLPEDHEFFIGSADEIYAVYQRSLSAVAYLIDRWGEGKAERLYARIGSADGPGTAAARLDGAFEAVLGLSLNDFERAWASSI